MVTTKTSAYDRAIALLIRAKDLIGEGKSIEAKEAINQAIDLIGVNDWPAVETLLDRKGWAG